MKTVALILSFVLSQAYVRAQEVIPLPANANLDSLSSTYFAACDDQCLVLDAVKDKLIQPDKPYHIDYSFQVLSINGKYIPVPLNEKYLNKIKQLEKCRGYAGKEIDFKLSMGNDKVYVYPVFDHTSKGFEAPKYVFSHADDSLLVNKLAAANIISLSENAVSIRYSNQGVWVNNRKLSLKQERRFLPLIQRVTQTPASNETVALKYKKQDIQHYAVCNNKLIHF